MKSRSIARCCWQAWAQGVPGAATLATIWPAATLLLMVLCMPARSRGSMELVHFAQSHMQALSLFWTNCPRFAVCVHFAICAICTHAWDPNMVVLV